MKGTITISLPEEVESELAEATREEGVSQGELINKAVADYLFVRKFRRLRDRMMADTQEGYTDQGIFDRVS